MSDYLLPVDDGLPARESGEWVKEKLYYVKRYIDAFEIAMRDRSWRRRIFIDLFSGPGKCVVRGTNEYLIGSPLLALQTQYPFTDYYFGDLEQYNIDSLRQRVSESLIPIDRIHLLVGNANSKVRVLKNKFLID
jgi:three-Cys-motif partner protein